MERCDESQSVRPITLSATARRTGDWDGWTNGLFRISYSRNPKGAIKPFALRTELYFDGVPIVNHIANVISMDLTAHWCRENLGEPRNTKGSTWWYYRKYTKLAPGLAGEVDASIGVDSEETIGLIKLALDQTSPVDFFGDEVMTRIWRSNQY